MPSSAVAEPEVHDVQTADARSANAPEPSLNIGTLADSLPSRKGSPVAMVSVVLHLAVLTLVLIVPVLVSSELPEPAPQVRAFLVEPAAIAPPPPPPPPPAPRAAATAVRRPEPLAPSDFVAPIDVPEDVPSDEGLDLGVEGGVPGGVEGGVEGGVVGGVIGGLPEAPPPPVAPVRVGGTIKEPKKLRNVVPEYPDLARQAGVKGVVILEAVISPDGRVQKATVLRSVPLLDEAALTAVRQWVYSPTLMNGIPVPVVLTVTVNFDITRR